LEQEFRKRTLTRDLLLFERRMISREEGATFFFARVPRSKISMDEVAILERTRLNRYHFIDFLESLVGESTGSIQPKCM
jgi:hypothetical protein